MNILQDDSDFVFNFADPNKTATAGAGGKLISAKADNFPALIGNGLALSTFRGAFCLISPFDSDWANAALLDEQSAYASTCHRSVSRTSQTLEHGVNHRMTEVLLMTKGKISAGFLSENGARFVVNDVPELAATIFPMVSAARVCARPSC